MPYDFAENEYELDSLVAAARGGGPPRKSAGIDVLDPPFPPKGPNESIPTAPSSLFIRVLAGLILTGLAIALLFLLFAKH